MKTSLVVIAHDRETLKEKGFVSGCRVVPEYPDADKFSSIKKAEKAAREVARNAEKALFCVIVRDHGLETEAVVGVV